MTQYKTKVDLFSASYWFKNALAAAMTRDPVDAARDAALLAKVLAERADAVLSESNA